MANGATDTAAQPEAAEGGVHRLRDIVVEEVSLVDRAANKRRFLIVKRSDGMTKPKQQSDDETAGSAKTKKGKPKTAPSKEAAARSRRGAPAKGPGNETEAEKVDDNEDDEDEAKKAGDDEEEDEAEKADDNEDDEDDDDEAKKADDSDDEEDDEDAKKADDSNDDDDDDGDDKDAKKAEDSDDEDDDTEKARGVAAGDEADLDDGRKPRSKHKTAKADDDAALTLPASIKNALLRMLAQALERLMAVANRVKTADAPDDGDASVPEDVSDELEDIGELLEDIGERLPTTKAITKGGARMARNRLDRFKKALESLSQLLKELTEAKGPTLPTAGAAEATTKRNTAPGLTELVASVSELTQLVKRQSDELVQMRKTRATSNAIPVDGQRRERREPPDVSWPLDMNRPISRDSVAKAVSFYDDGD